MIIKWDIHEYEDKLRKKREIQATRNVFEAVITDIIRGCNKDNSS